MVILSIIKIYTAQFRLEKKNSTDDFASCILQTI